MTGFGRAEGNFEGKKISVDIRSLNGKNIDLNIRIPLFYKEKEFEIRKILSETIVRGKADCYISIEHMEENPSVIINHNMVKSYVSELKSISKDGRDIEYLKIAMRLPEAVSTKSEELSSEEWNVLKKLIEEALSQFNNFRKTEGDCLRRDLDSNIENIGKFLKKVEPYESERIRIIKEKYEKALKDFESIDETRYYQEVVYYIEKLDISEEKTRLAQHLKYYKEVMENEQCNGKKLGFIAQEIGREINTLGSKSNHSEIQKLVVMMKDDLEKIKEQTLNIL